MREVPTQLEEGIMKTVVITGSTRGIGFGLAKEFLASGCAVVVSGRSQDGVDASVASLKTEFPDAKILGVPCDVTDSAQIQSLWNSAVEAFDTVEIWINNAGIGHGQQTAWELSEETINKVVDIDFLGLVFGTQVALRGMLEQDHGQIYNMEGFGSDGAVRAGMSIYGASKRAVRYYTRSVIKETKNSPVQVGFLSPGIVITDFITDMYQGDSEGFEKSKKIFNILGDKVETVTPWMVNKVLKNNKSGASFRWLTPGKAFSRFLTAGFKRRDLFALDSKNQLLGSGQ